MSKWKKLSSEILSFEFIRENKDKVNWEKICRNTINKSSTIPYDFIREFEDKIRWDILIKVPHEARFYSEFGHHFSPDQWANLMGNNKIFSDELVLRFVNIFYNWKAIAVFRELNEEFIEKYKDYLSWDTISFHQNLSEQFIERHIDKINPLSVIRWKRGLSEKHLRGLIFNRDREINNEWSDGSKQQIHTIEFLREFQDKIDWDTYMLTHNDFPPNFFKEFKEKLHTDILVGCKGLTEDFIERYAEEWNWFNVVTCQKISNECIKRNLHRFDKLDGIFQCQKLDEDTIEYILEHAKKLFEEDDYRHWRTISYSQTLSEAFIERHAEEVSWYEILTKQNVSVEFMKKWIHKLDKVEIQSFKRNWLEEKYGIKNDVDL